jgi:hypothetical protein
MKAIDVSYTSGRELLGAYWGLLANGGLVVDNQSHLREGDAVTLRVTLGKELGKELGANTYTLHGHVARVPRDDVGRERVVIAFDPGQPQDLMLDAAWADTENSAQRRDRRFPLDVDVKYHSEGANEARARMVNVSRNGCCLRLPRAPITTVAVGEPLTVSGDAHTVSGVVRWAIGSCRGIEFDGAEPSAVDQFVKQFR